MPSPVKATRDFGCCLVLMSGAVAFAFGWGCQVLEKKPCAKSTGWHTACLTLGVENGPASGGTGIIGAINEYG